MTRWQVVLALALGLFGLGLATGLGWGAHRASGKAQQAQVQSDQHEVLAQTHAAQAAVADRQATLQTKTVQTADARVVAAKRGLDQSLKALPVNAPVSHQDDVSLAALSQAQAVIMAQDQEIAALKLQVSIEHAAAVQWHAAYDESQKALALQKIAADAAVHSESRRGFLHSLETGAISAVVGYAAGRAR